jgi:hypothetical protein
LENGNGNGSPDAIVPRRTLSMRKPSEVLDMIFDDSDRILGDRLLAKGQPLTILAPGGTGKSRILLQLLACIITEKPFCGFECRGKSMKWLVLQTENSCRRLQSDLNRLKAWLTQKEWETVDNCLLLHTMEHDDDGMVYLSDRDNQAAIAKTIEDFKPDGIAFDPLGDFAVGDPNRDQDMRDTCRMISKICKKGHPDRCIIVVHHAITGRAGAAKATGYDRTSYARNSKVLHSWTRGQINIATGSPDNNEHLVIACGKCSNGKEFETFSIRLNTNTLIYEEDPTFDVESWQKTIGVSNSSHEPIPERIRELCPITGISKMIFSRIIRDEFGCSKPTSYRYIMKAEQLKLVIRSRSDSNYFRG